MKRLVDLEPKVIELHESGLSDVQIARIIGHGSSYVRHVRVRYGYERKNPIQTQLKIKVYPTIDHVVPLIKSGNHSWDNVKLAHLHCNASKGANE